MRLHFTGTCSRSEFDEATSRAGDWYHSFYFDNGFEVRGDYDIGRDVEAYGFPEDMRGLRVLDVGAASGWFSFYFERRGADVTAFDIRGPEDWDLAAGYVWPRPEEFGSEWMASFRVMRELLGSRVERVRGRVYDISAAMFAEPFDLVFMGSLLLHLRDPIGALMAARRVCRGRLVATNWFLEAEGPLADLPSPGNAWWRATRQAHVAWCRAAGFGAVDVERTVTLSADRIDPRRNNQTQTLLLLHAHV